MEPYELICAVNQAMLKGRIFSDAEKKENVERLLSAVSSRETAARFQKGVNAPQDGRKLYPLFFIPPYNDGKKLRLFTGELPKTQILSANHYELEALRILALWSPDDETVHGMLDKTVQRLDTTCFARFCDMGECVGAGIAALRFLSAAYPQDSAWIERILTPMLRLYEEGNKNVPVYYLYSALIEINDESCRELFKKKESWLIHMLRSGRLTSPVTRAAYHEVRLHILKKALLG